MIRVKLVTLALCLGLVAGSPAATKAARSLGHDDQKGNRIVGGYDAVQGQFPYQVSMRRLPNFHFCGGSIISSRWVLSAAHCTIGMEPAGLNVYVGSVRLETGGVYHRTMRIVNHPLYDAATIENDISLAQTVAPIVFNEYTQPIPLGSTYVLSGNGAVISGWGRSNTMDDGPAQVPDNLQYLTVDILTMEECRAERNGSNNIFDSVMCVSSPAGQGACSGDSGGPLVFDVTFVLKMPPSPGRRTSSWFRREYPTYQSGKGPSRGTFRWTSVEEDRSFNRAQNKSSLFVIDKGIRDHTGTLVH